MRILDIHLSSYKDVGARGFDSTFHSIPLKLSCLSIDSIEINPSCRDISDVCIPRSHIYRTIVTTRMEIVATVLQREIYFFVRFTMVPRLTFSLSHHHLTIKNSYTHITYSYLWVSRILLLLYNVEFLIFVAFQEQKLVRIKISKW